MTLISTTYFDETNEHRAMIHPPGKNFDFLIEASGARLSKKDVDFITVTLKNHDGSDFMIYHPKGKPQAKGIQFSFSPLNVFDRGKPPYTICITSERSLKDYQFTVQHDF